MQKVELQKLISLLNSHDQAWLKEKMLSLGIQPIDEDVPHNDMSKAAQDLLAHLNGEAPLPVAFTEHVTSLLKQELERQLRQKESPCG